LNETNAFSPHWGSEDVEKFTIIELRIIRNRHQDKGGVLELAKELWNVSKASRVVAYSRDTSIGSRNCDGWMVEYNEHRPHQNRWCYGKTPIQTFMDSAALAKEKILAA
jgi:hypothetical protein